MPITTTPSGGPQGEFSTYTPIYSQTLTSTAASVTFSNIPQTYTDLVLIANSKDSRVNSGVDDFTLRFNSDSSNNYSCTALNDNASFRTSNQGLIALSQPGASDSFGTTIINVQNYNNVNTYKTCLVRTGMPTNVRATVGLYRSTAAITSITVLGEQGFSSGSTFTLYGIKAAAAQFIPTKAAGGDIVVSDGTYAYHAFLSTGSFKPAQSLTADVLVISGGGSAGYSSYGQGGGGGAGGISYNASQSFSSSSTYTMTVGAGGATTSGNGNQGNTSSCIGGALSFSVVGGGGGGGGSASATGTAGGNGACGGGSQGNNTTGGTGSVGFNGGSASNDSNRFASGGGGGMGAAGGNGTGGGAPATAGAGGNGVSTYSSWGSAVGFGHGISGTYWFAGGGGGGADNNGAGGNGGGGTNGLPGMFATGGGGGARTGGTTGAAGGSGIVIVRYAL